MKLKQSINYHSVLRFGVLILYLLISLPLYLDKDYVWMVISAVILLPLLTSNLSPFVSDNDHAATYGTGYSSLLKISIFLFPVLLITYIFIKSMID